MKIINDSYKLGRGFSRIETNKTLSGEYDVGSVFTPHGIVCVYAQGDASSSSYTRLDFVRSGRHHMRNFLNKRYSKRGLAKIARAFAKELISQ